MGRRIEKILQFSLGVMSERLCEKGESVVGHHRFLRDRLGDGDVSLPRAARIGIWHTKAGKIKPPDVAFSKILLDLLRREALHGADGSGAEDIADLGIRAAEHLAQDFVGMLAEQRRSGHIGRAR